MSTMSHADRITVCVFVYTYIYCRYMRSSIGKNGNRVMSSNIVMRGNVIRVMSSHIVMWSNMSRNILST